jgi:FlgD Ig-like domain
LGGGAVLGEGATMFPNHGRSITFGLIACFSALLLAPWPQEVGAAETVTVDYHTPRGLIDDHVGAGLMGQWADVLPDSLISLLKPPAVRVGNLWQNSNNLWVRAAHNNTTVVIVVKDAVDARPEADPIDKDFTNHWSTSNPVDSLARMSEWKDHVHHWVNLVAAHRVVAGDTVRVQYDIWNEPDISWHPDSAYNSLNLFFDVWNTAADSIRVWDPGAVITGPSFAYAGNGAGIEVGDRSGITMDIFLQRCYAAGTLPDVLGSHHIGYSDYTAPNSVDGPCRWNLYAQVADLRDRVNTVFGNIPGSGIDADSFTYEINEMLTADLPNPDWCQNPYTGPAVHPVMSPGVLVRNFALAERARADGLGLLFASRTVWCDPCSTCIGGTYFYLAHLIDPCAADFLSPRQFRPRYAWWVHRAYADITGSYVHASTTGSVDAIAGVCASADTSRILIGNYSPGDSTNLCVVLQNLNSTDLVVNEVIQVTVKRLPGAPDSVYLAYVGLAPTLISNGRVPVDRNSAVVNIPSDKCGPGDAVSIEVTRIMPGATIARGNYPSVEAAILATDIGDTVIVVPLGSGLPYDEPNIHLKNGVKVIAKAGTLPIFVGHDETDADTVIVFPSNANNFTSLEGLELRAGPWTKVLASLGGSGSIQNCTLRDMGEPKAAIGVLSDAESGRISNCRIDFGGAPESSGAKFGVKILSGVTNVDSCSITVHRDGASEGIHSDEEFGGEVTNTFVKGGNHGIYGVNLVLRGCTTDSSYDAGIVLEAGLTESCISKGIIGQWIINCIVDYEEHGLGSSQYTVVEDPLFCSPGNYHLRPDSYGNPVNNPLHELIGPFPVGDCLFGTLVRSVEYAGNGTLNVPADLTIPSQKTLTLGPLTTLKMRSPDSLSAGSDHQKVELVVASGGTLNIAGADSNKVVLTSSKASPAEGDWWGIKVNSGGTANIDHADLRYSDYGIQYLSTTSGHISHSFLEKNTIADITAGVGGGTMALRIDNDTIAVGGGKGIRLESIVRGLTIENNRIIGDAPPIYSYGGINFGGFTNGEYPTISGNFIQAFAYGYGIYAATGAPTIEENEIQYCGYGIQTSGGTALIGSAADSSSDNLIHGNWVGIWVDGGTPVIRNNQIVDNFYTGVVIRYSGNPNLGTHSDHGKNTFTGYYTHCIDNENSGVTVNALGNYFGSCSAPSCTHGSVNTDEYACTPPAGVNLAVEALPARLALHGLVPNPMRSAGQIAFSLPEAADRVRLCIYDLAGRLVRDFGENRGTAGLNRILWDGMDDRGTSVMNGIYFIRLTMNAHQVGAAKALVVR